MDNLLFAVELLVLTFSFALLVALLGNAVVDGHRQRTWGVIASGLGLLLAYPLTLTLVSMLPRRVALGLYLALLVLLWTRIASRERETVGARALHAVRQAALLAVLSDYLMLRPCAA